VSHITDWKSVVDHPAMSICHVGKMIAKTGMYNHFVSEMAHTLPLLFADAVLLLVMRGGGNQLDVVFVEEGKKLNGHELAARINVKFSNM
jgi:hypothetical protein